MFITNNHSCNTTGTDITARWKMLGWIPPSQLQEYKNKWSYFQNLKLKKAQEK
jgi:hypothetical protein